MRVVAFLRAINVGGHNRVAMADLRDAFETAGFDDVSTYIQSGNVLFSHTGEIEPLYPRIEELLETRFGFRIPVILRTKDELRDILDKAPFDQEDEDYSHQFVSLFRHTYEADLPPNPANGSCSYLAKTDREIYSQWWKVEGKYEVPAAPKGLAPCTSRNREVLRAIREKL